MSPFATAWAQLRQAGCPAAGRQVGVVSHNVPIELVLACGLAPVRLVGDPGDSTEMADVYMEPFFDGPVRSLFNRFLTGRFDGLAQVIVPRSSEAYLQLYYFLQQVQRWKPDLHLPPVVLFDVLHTPYWTTGRYVHQQVLDLKAALEACSGNGIGDADLQTAIGQCNTVRRLLAQTNALRRREQPRLSGEQMLQIIAAAGALAPAPCGHALRTLLADADQLPVREGVRLMVKGSPHDDLGFYRLVESLGAVIVADDHLAGERSFEGLVDEQADPWEALSDKYHRHSPSIRSFPQTGQDEHFMALVSSAHAQGVIFFLHEFDDTLGWDYPRQKRLLDEQGIPSLYLKEQPYFKPDRAAQGAVLAPWIRAVSDASRRTAGVAP